MTWFLDTAAAAGVVGLVSGAFVPALIARVPEPAPVEGEDADELEAAEDEADYARPVDAPKETYLEVSRLPGLRWKCALASGVAAALIGGRVSWTPALLFLLPLVPVCVALAVIDWRTRYLPTWLIRPTFVAVAFLAALAAALTSDPDALVTAAIGSAATFAFFFVIWFVLPRAWAYGDVRLAGLLGLALGYVGVGALVVGIWVGFLLGGVGGLLLARLRIFHQRHIPLGPFLVLGALIGLVFWAEIGAAYVALVGGTAG